MKHKTKCVYCGSPVELSLRDGLTKFEIEQASKNATCPVTPLDEINWEPTDWTKVQEIMPYQVCTLRRAALGSGFELASTVENKQTRTGVPKLRCTFQPRQIKTVKK